MTDKQIIIDGVDVSGCCHQGKNETCTCPHYKNECTRNPNCHYKIMERQVKKLDKLHKRNLELEQQLKRKEQECEELKNFHINLVGVKECEIKELLKLKQTLAEIKELLLKTPTNSQEHCVNAKSVILQKINEVIDE